MSLKEYEIMNKIGNGSFGVVYKAKMKSNQQVCVVKEIDMQKFDHRMKNWALNEAKLMKDINSKYIVKSYNSFIQNSKLYIIMQYCDKGDLATYIRSQMGKPLKQQQIWKIAIQIMVGLRDLHSQKILHRDIKALNIFLNENGDVRIGDLGVAKTMKTDFTNTVVGTPYYLSPEMCQEKPYNEKTDVWAMGCLIYQLCTGRYPFEAQNQASLALKIVMGKFKQIPSNYSKDLDLLIRSCLSVDYKRRPTVNYLLTRPRIIEQAKKVNVIIQKQSDDKPSCDQKVTHKVQRKSISKNLPPKKVNKPVSTSKKTHQSSFHKARASQLRPTKIVSSHKKEKVLSAHKKVQQQQHQPKFIKANPPKVNSSNQENYKVVHDFPKQIPIPNCMQREQQLKPPPKMSMQSPVSHRKQSSKSNLTSQNKYDYFQVREEINKEDRHKHQSTIQYELPQEEEDKNQSKAINMQKHAKVIGLIQTTVQDAELEIQLGITPEKINKLQNCDLIKTKTINWDCNEQSIPLKQSTISDYKELPTIKNEENIGTVKVMIDHSGEIDQVYEEIDDNQPYKSDEEESFGAVDDQLVEQIQQYGLEGHESTSKIKENMSRKIQQNQKRRIQIIKKKVFHENQLLSVISISQYEDLKNTILNGSEKQLVTVIKDTRNLVKFYKILHYDIQIERCQHNINSYRQKMKNQK